MKTRPTICGPGKLLHHSMKSPPSESKGEGRAITMRQWAGTHSFWISLGGGLDPIRLRSGEAHAVLLAWSRAAMKKQVLTEQRDQQEMQEQHSRIILRTGRIPKKVIRTRWTTEEQNQKNRRDRRIQELEMELDRHQAEICRLLARGEEKNLLRRRR